MVSVYLNKESDIFILRSKNAWRQFLFRRIAFVRFGTMDIATNVLAHYCREKSVYSYSVRSTLLQTDLLLVT